MLPCQGELEQRPEPWRPAFRRKPSPRPPTLRYDQPGETTYDASLGVAKDHWTARLYGQNLSNSDASTFTSSAQFIKSEAPLRPRVVGINVGYKF
jgi:iron complex outermembrane recepter protein